MPQVQLEQIRSIAERVARSYGLDLFDVQFRREAIGLVLRVILDRPYNPGAGASRPAGALEEGVGIEECQRVSHDISAILDVDVDDSIDQNYTLEVSSPGLDRPLRHAVDYQRFIGRLAKIVVTEPVDGQKHFEGRLEGLEEETVLLTQGRRTHRIPFAAISRARLEVEF